MAERLLLLETSSKAGWVAVAEADSVRAVRHLAEARRNARDLAPKVAELLAGQGWKPRNVTAVIVSRGPGSYTGLRVGLMSAKAFTYATGCSLIAIDTFAALALQAPAEAAVVEVLSDAQQDRVYWQRFSRPLPDGIPTATTPLAIVRFAEWLRTHDPTAWVTGPGLRVPGRALPAATSVVASDAWDVRPESLLRLGLRRLRAGERDDVWAVEPIYLRPSSAEEQWDRLIRQGTE